MKAMLRLGIILLSVTIVAAADDNIVCPDGKSMCFDTETCCQMASGEYGCCPLPNAVCCSDNVHCCPYGYTCNLVTISCDRNGHIIPMLEHKTGKLLPQKMLKASQALTLSTTNRIICPDKSSYCSDDNTCCKTKSQGYACCPLPNAVCCIDGVHCCPSGYSCSDAFCMKTRGTSAMKFTKEEDETACSHSHDRCPSGNTCCPMDHGEYGCCPISNAVCCPDKEHCCPPGFKCNDSQSRCTANGNSVPYLRKIKPKKRRKITGSKKLRPLEAKIKNIVFCPDQISRCPSNFTCCKSIWGLYECCPLPNATCCKDHKHCCPHGTECDIVSMSCKSKQDGVSTPWILREKAKRLNLNSVTCPDRTACPTGYTCCLLSSGMYGCCPYPNAVCCSDQAHCCPHGTTCDVASGACLQDTKMELQSLIINKFVIDIQPNSHIICPDHKAFCHAGNTCCELSSGGFGCCPYKKAVCCSDKTHCCPYGMKCDLQRGKCVKKDYKVPMRKKIPALKIGNGVQITCPDESSCPSGYTCCKLSSGGYGCCPYEEAVCCSDGQHCCPHGTTCNLSAGTCDGESNSILMTKISRNVKKVMVTCPDESSCPSGYTCCKLSSGGYGCCPYEEAVCCSDGQHCCPHGTTCNLSAGTCDGESNSILMTKISQNVKKVMVTCPDESSCPSGYTCCKLSSGGYGCCPYEEAVCCSDGQHCCPHGTTCNLSTGTCDGESNSILMTKISRNVKKVMVTCPDQSSCPSGYTCCKLSSGGYGCCPYEEAVCCSDGQHCCPHGTTCNLSAGTCDGESNSILMTKISRNVKKVMLTCPDESSCPSGYTCCKLSSGGYGCCPYEEAVCCSDGQHCCPHGTTCNLSAGTCDGESNSILMSRISRNVKTVNARNTICPDGISSCPNHYTCCKLQSGDYGCCPLSDAVCCKDGQHCCPKGTTCHLSTQTCVSGNKIFQIFDMKKKIKAVRSLKGSLVKCADEFSTCPDGYTCCENSSGGFGCCKHPKAVCCKDGKHCCPHGTSCDLSSGHCLYGTDFVALQDEVIEANSNAPSIICPGGRESCPDGNTCCSKGGSEFGCCPKEHAVCCSDKKHCCPNGFTCGAEGFCMKGAVRIKAIGHASIKKHTNRKFSFESKLMKNNDIICPDKATSCLEGTSCCLNPDKETFSCCPIKKAVCCPDHIHCCPSGWRCDTEQGTCRRGNDGYVSSPLMKKLPGRKTESHLANAPGYDYVRFP